MPAFTRTTHTVRIKSADERFYADVEVLDALSLTLPNGFKIVYRIAKGAINSPTIVDLTGDNGGQNAKAGGKTSSRSSHMVRVTSTTNTKMFLDVEVCDAFTLTGPNNADFVIQCPSPGKSVPAITDTTGSNLGVDAVPGSTRAQHAVKLLHQVGPGAAGQPEQQVETDYTLTVLTDAIIHKGPLQTQGMPWQADLDLGGTDENTSIPQPSEDPEGLWYDNHVLQFYNMADLINGALSIGANTNDITQYVEDPDTGDMVPPPNTDDNIYVYFPQVPVDSKGTGGPFLGATPYTADFVPNAQGAASDQQTIAAIDMGPIWWIRALGVTDNVWFWFLSPVQQPLALSFFGTPPEPANPKWAYRGFTLLPDFPVAWILSENFPLIPMGTYGAPDLDTAAGGYTIVGGDGTIIVNWGGVGVPNGFWGVNTELNDTEALINAGSGGFLAPIQYLGSNFYMPYGAFDLTAPTAAEILAALIAKGGAGKGGPNDPKSYTDFGGPPPNIWELVGLPQPPLRDPTKVWNPTTNPHKQPSLSLAKQAAQIFRQNWNAVANALNEGLTGPGAAAGFPFVPPPGWAWNRPYGGNTVPTAMMFSNAWHPTPAVPEETVPFYIPTIDVGQLDPTIWNVGPVITDGTPPVKWATGVP
jgi:hypothetical protein